MTDSKKINATKGRLMNSFDKITHNTIQNTVPKQIEEAISDVSMKTGVITKFYPYLDKAEVQLDLTKKKVFCKILHRFCGDLIDFYTPIADKKGFNKKLQEPYIVPKFRQNVCVLNIRDADSNEHLVLGCYNNKDIVNFNPAKPGNLKIMHPCEDGNEYWLKFGKDGFSYRVKKTPNRYVGDKHEDEGVKEFDYPMTTDVYTKKEVDKLINEKEIYTKAEVDALLQVYDDRIKQLEDIIKEE